MRRTVLAVAIFTASAMNVPSSTMACTCSPDELSTEQALAEEDAVFVGQVIQLTLRERPGPDNADKLEPVVDDDDVEARFRIVSSWKGVDSRETTVSTAWMGTACGYSFRLGQSYLVFATKRSGETTLSTSSCSRTQNVLDAAKQLSTLGKPKHEIK